MKAEDIVDRKSFAAWLKEHEPDQGVAVWLAARGALRVLPLAWSCEGRAKKRDLTRVTLLRCFGLSDIASLRSTSDRLKAAADAAGTAGAADATDHAADAATFAADAAVAVDATGAARAATFAVGAVAYSADAVYAEIAVDCADIERGEAQTNTALWRAGSSPFVDTWAQIAQTERSRAATSGDEMARGGQLDWTFWVDWYDDVLAGEPRNIPMMEEIALEVDWDKEPDLVLAHIDAIRGKYAAASLPNGERVSVNPETGKHRVDPVTKMQDGIMPEVLAKIDSLLDMPDFQNAESNQYSALSSELSLLRQGRDAHETAPRLLHSVCVRVAARLQNKIDNFACPEPEKDANIEDFQHVLTDVIADLTTYDPKVKETVIAKAKTRFELNTAITEPVAVADDALAEISEDVLAREMPEYAKVLRDPEASDEEKAEAFYVSASRLLRVAAIKTYSGAKLTAEEAEWWSERGVKIAKNVVLIGGSVTAPAWLPAAIKAILVAI